MSSSQKPIGSPFKFESTAADVIKGIDLTGKVAIVTGGYSGIGTETSRVLREAGATVIVPCRDLKKGAAALQGIDVELEQMDLLDPASIDAFADRFLQSGRPLHILVNSAGIMACPLTRDSRGYESQFATNHLGHFQLTNRLWPALVKANGARIVSVSSWGHRFSPLHLEDVNYENREYDRFGAYGQSKTANVLFAVEADKRGKKDNIRAFAIHPGAIIDTNLGRHMTNADFQGLGIMDESGKLVDTSAFKSVAQGAATQVWFATSPQLDGLGGIYGEDCEVSHVIEPESNNDNHPKVPDLAKMPKGVMTFAIDPDVAAKLWTLSEKLLAKRAEPQAV